MNQREYDDKRNRDALREQLLVQDQMLLGMAEVTAENERLLLANNRLLELINNHVITYNDVGGVDANDLADDVRAEGFELPGDD